MKGDKEEEKKENAESTSASGGKDWKAWLYEG